MLCWIQVLWNYKNGCGINLNKKNPLGWYINSVLLWWQKFRGFFSLLCFFVFWVQLSQICVAPPGCLDICQTQLCPAVSKGGSYGAWLALEFEAGDVVKGKFGCQRLDGALLGHIYSSVHQDNKRASSGLHNPYQFFTTINASVFSVRHGSKHPNTYSEIHFMLLDMISYLRVINSCESACLCNF